MRFARRVLVAALLVACATPVVAQEGAPRRIDSARFTVVFYPADERLAHAILRAAVANDSFPWLPRPKEPALIAIAPDGTRFREWAGSDAPEWGAALAFPETHRIVMQGHSASSDAGDPLEVIRHELAHLALHENLGALPPRWFDEGYASVAAREWRRDDVLAANIGLALHGTPTFDQLDAGFQGGSNAAQASYALSYRAVTELASLDPDRGLTLFFRYWKEKRRLDPAVRQAFGLTLGGFEKVYQDRTRHTYGALALLADFSLAMFVLSLLVLPFFVSRRLRDKERLKAMLVADAAAEKVQQESALELLLNGSPEALVDEAGLNSPREDEPPT